VEAKDVPSSFHFVHEKKFIKL